MKPQTITLGLWIGAAALAGAGHAQTSSCAERAIVVERLAADYGETRQAIGLVSAEQVVEVFASEETGSWTITVTRADGMTCLMAAGHYYEELDEAVSSAAVGDPA